MPWAHLLSQILWDVSFGIFKAFQVIAMSSQVGEALPLARPLTGAPISHKLSYPRGLCCLVYPLHPGLVLWSRPLWASQLWPRTLTPSSR